MPSGSSNQECPFRILLADYLAEIHELMGVMCHDILDGRRWLDDHRQRAGKHAHDFSDISGRHYLHSGNQSGLDRIFFWDNDTLVSLFLCKDHRRQNSLDRSDSAIESQLTDHEGLIQKHLVDFALF